MFEFLTLQPMFVGDTEGLQLFEMIALLGNPTKEDLEKMQKVIDPKILPILAKCDQLETIPDLVAMISLDNFYLESDLV